MNIRVNLSFLMIFSLSGFDQNAWDKVTLYTFENKTIEPLFITWQSGGGRESVLSGKNGSFNLPPSERYTIQVAPNDCLDTVSVKGLTTGRTAQATRLCNSEILIRQAGLLKDEQLIIE